MSQPQSTDAVASDSELRRARDADEDTAEDTLSDQVARTDAALHAWRSESVKRRATYEAARQRAEAQRLEQRRKAMRVGALTLLAAVLTVFGVGTLVHNVRIQSDERGSDARAAEARAAAPRPPLSRIAVAEGVVVPEAPVAEVPVVAAAPVVAVAAPVAAPARVSGSVQVLPGSVRLWTEEGHAWAAFATTTRGAIRFRYLDGAGNPVLEPIGCQTADPDGIRRCSAGRSQVRVHRAVEEGAVAGTWTVQACGASGCSDLGTFPVR